MKATKLRRSQLVRRLMCCSHLSSIDHCNCLSLPAAAEIAKILSAPSARDIVLGHHAHHHSSSASIATWDSDSSSSTSNSNKGGSSSNPTPWLKTPSEEGRFTYSHKKLVSSFPAAMRAPRSSHAYYCRRGPSPCARTGTTLVATTWTPPARSLIAPTLVAPYPFARNPPVSRVHSSLPSRTIAHRNVRLRGTA